MRNFLKSYLILPVFAALSFSVSAAPIASSAAGASVAEVASDAPTVTGTAGLLQKINLNDADALTLQQQLNGIGQAKAQAIVAYREANGPFQSVDELLEIKGIGNALMERNRDRLTLE